MYNKYPITLFYALVTVGHVVDLETCGTFNGPMEIREESLIRWIGTSGCVECGYNILWYGRKKKKKKKKISKGSILKYYWLRYKEDRIVEKSI